jgi:hypothetical protein
MTAEFIERMEDVLDLYEKQYDFKEPVICLDEKPVQLVKDTREPISAKPGSIKKRDYEYIRAGTANVFCIVEPKGGRHFTYVTRNRQGKEFAKVLNRMADHYSHADKIHLVMDNLRTHSLKSLTDFYGEVEGAEIWNKFEIHFTPKHASGLDQAEIEIGIYSRQCLGKSRIGDIDELRKRTKAWNKEVNKKKLKINWKFTTKTAREKFKYNHELKITR